MNTSSGSHKYYQYIHEWENHKYITNYVGGKDNLGEKFSPWAIFPCFFPKNDSPICIFWSLVSPNFMG